MDGLVDGGGVRGDHSLGRVDIVGGVVDMGSLNNLLDGVNLVGGGDGDSTGNSDLVRGGHMLVHDDLTLDGNGNMDGDVNVVVLYIELRDDVGGLGNVFNSGNSVLVATNNRDLSSLHNLVSDNSVLNTVLNDGSSSSVGVVGLAYNSRGRSHRGTVGHSGTSSVSTGGGNSR